MFKQQVIPLALTIIIFAILVAMLHWLISVLNLFTPQDIALHIRWGDVLVGMTIYLKTSVDFAIFIGNLMHAYPGWKNRVAIEIGTAAGNAFGTFIILIIWTFFKDIHLLLALMVFIASLVLIRMAEEGFEHVETDIPWLKSVSKSLNRALILFNKPFEKFLNVIIPKTNMRLTKSLTFFGLFGLSFTVPFILGLDDFAGYVPLFDVVNVYGFAIGVFLGHMLLNIFLFISPEHTIKLVKNAYISFIGSIVFIGLAVWGMIEVVKIVFELH
jgi:hypothetical protein